MGWLLFRFNLCFLQQRNSEKPRWFALPVYNTEHCRKMAVSCELLYVIYCFVLSPEWCFQPWSSFAGLTGNEWIACYTGVHSYVVVRVPLWSWSWWRDKNIGRFCNDSCWISDLVPFFSTGLDITSFNCLYWHIWFHINWRCGTEEKAATCSLHLFRCAFSNMFLYRGWIFDHCECLMTITRHSLSFSLETTWQMHMFLLRF